MISSRLKLPRAAVLAALGLAPAALAAPAVELEAVVVTAARQAQRAADSLAAIEVIERAQLERAGHSSLIEVLRATAGVRITANGGAGTNTNVYLRGAEARHTLLLIDGMRVGSASSGAPTLESIPLALVERIEILRGPASALYGSEAIGGVIQIFTRKPAAGFQPELAFGFGTERTRKADVALSGGSERWRYHLNVGEERTDGFNSKRDRSYWTPRPPRTSYWPDHDGFRNAYVNAALTLQLGARDELGLSVMQTDGRSRYDASALSYYDSYIDKRIGSAQFHLRNELGRNWSSTLRFGRGRDEARTRASAAAPSRHDTRQDQLSWQHDIGLDHGKLLLAYEQIETRLKSTTAYDKDRRRVHSLLLGWSADFGVHHLQLNSRHDDNSQFGSKLTGVLGYGYDLSPAWRLRASIGSAFNAPTFNQLYWPLAALTEYHGNPELRPERALNRELGLRWQQGAHSIELSYFDNRVKDLIASNPVPARRGEQINIARARLQGVELGYALSRGSWQLDAGMDWLNAKDEQNGRRLPRRARVAGFLRVHHAAATLDWGLEWEGAGRRHDDAANLVSLHGYGLLNAYAQYRLAPQWQLELRANNFLDRSYELARGYRTPGASAFIGVRYAPR